MYANNSWLSWFMVLQRFREIWFIVTYLQCFFLFIQHLYTGILYVLWIDVILHYPIFHRYSNLEKEYQRTVETSEQEMRTLKNKMEASLEFMKQEHNIASAKVNKFSKMHTQWKNVFNILLMQQSCRTTPMQIDPKVRYIFLLQINW